MTRQPKPKPKKIEETRSFLKELANDVEIAKVRLNNDGSNSNLREFIRTTYAAIEAQAWNTRMHLLNDILDKSKLSEHEIAALKEETYQIGDNGTIKSIPKGYTLKVGLKLIIKILNKNGFSIEENFNDKRWQSIDEVTKIRNRITHPKSMEDITVTMEEAVKCYEAFLFVQSIFIDTLMAPLGKIFSDLTSGEYKNSRRRGFFKSN